ncbi:unnamed protein product [Lactuca virosa]|uniref:Uncharacterized protein n=1 Tax=Lactuca virosa TaxID=75947 RepID=A0AAU9PV85_9ASTR|nr:unnamed protein product [Lactuca virosa]
MPTVGGCVDISGGRDGGNEVDGDEDLEPTRACGSNGGGSPVVGGGDGSPRAGGGDTTTVSLVATGDNVCLFFKFEMREKIFM